MAFVTAKLNHELLSSRLSETAAHKKAQQLQTEISKLRSHSLRQEAQLDEKEQALSLLQGQLTSRCRYSTDWNGCAAATI